MLGLSIGVGEYSFPVGKIQPLRMYPLTFDEFLGAVGKAAYVEHIRECFAVDKPSTLHKELLGLFRRYQVVGGLPKVVSRYVEGSDILAAREEQTLLDATYVADMAQYLSPAEAARALEVWRSLPHQLGKENRKFQYSAVRSGGRAYMYETALAWLKATGLLLCCNRSSEGIAPFIADGLGSFFKAYVFDTGMLCSKMLRDPSALLQPESADVLNSRFRGSLAENVVMQALVANGVDAYYWESKGTAQVDFLYQDAKGAAVPIEVKSEDHVRSKSLNAFFKKYDPEYALRVSTKQFGFEDRIKSVPFYAVFCID
jgi:predicted AAA+ superfamily ATPase